MKKQSSIRNLLAAFGNKQDFTPLSPQAPSVAAAPAEANDDDDDLNSSDPLIGKTINADQTIEDEVRNLLGLAPVAPGENASSSVNPPVRKRGTITSHSRSAGNLDETEGIVENGKSLRSELRKSKSGDGTGSRYVRSKNGGSRQRSMRRLTTKSTSDDGVEELKKLDELPDGAAAAAAPTPTEDRRRTLTKIRQSSRRLKIPNDIAEDTACGKSSDSNGAGASHDEQKLVSHSDSMRSRDSSKSNLKRSVRGNSSSNRRSFRDSQTSSRMKSENGDENGLSVSLHGRSSVENKEPRSSGRRMSLRDKRSSSRRLLTGETQGLPQRMSLREKRQSSRRSSETSSRRLSSRRLSSTDKNTSSRQVSDESVPSSHDANELFPVDFSTNGEVGGIGHSILGLGSSNLEASGQQSFESRSDSNEDLFEQSAAKISSQKVPGEGNQLKEAASLLKPSSRDSRPLSERRRVKSSSSNSSQQRPPSDRKKRSSRKREKVHRSTSESSGHSNSIISSSDENNSMAEEVEDYSDFKEAKQKGSLETKEDVSLLPQQCVSSTHDRTAESKIQESDEPRVSKYLELKKRSSMRKVARDPYWEREKAVAEIVVRDADTEVGDSGAHLAEIRVFSNKGQSQSTHRRKEDAAVPEPSDNNVEEVEDSLEISEKEKTEEMTGYVGGEQQLKSQALAPTDCSSDQVDSSSDQVNIDIAMADGPLVDKATLDEQTRDSKSVPVNGIDREAEISEIGVTNSPEINGSHDEGVDGAVFREQVSEKEFPVAQASPCVQSSPQAENPQDSENVESLVGSGRNSDDEGPLLENGPSPPDKHVSERWKNFKLVDNINGLNGDKRRRRLSDSAFWRSERALAVKSANCNDVAAKEKETDSNSSCRNGNQYARRRSEGAVFIQSSINDLLISPISNTSEKEMRWTVKRDMLSKELKEDRWAAISPMRPVNYSGDVAIMNELLLSPDAVNPDMSRSVGSTTENNNRAPFAKKERSMSDDTTNDAPKTSHREATTQYPPDDRWAPISPMQPIVPSESNVQGRKSLKAMNRALRGPGLPDQNDASDSNEHFESIKEELREDRWAPISPMRPIVPTMKRELVQDLGPGDKARRWAASASNEVMLAEADRTKAAERLGRKCIEDFQSESEVSFDDSLLDEPDNMNATNVDWAERSSDFQDSQSENIDLRGHSQSLVDDDINEDECARMIARKTALEHLIGEHMETLNALRKELSQVEARLDNIRSKG